MEKQMRLRANDVTKSIVLSILTIAGVIWMWIQPEKVALVYKIMMPVFAIVSLCVLTKQLIFPVFLTQKGIQCFCFRKLIQNLQWDELEEVCVMHTFSASKNSASKRIVFVPAGCDTFGSQNWTEQRYLRQFRHKVLMVDDTRKNRAFINQYYGDIVIYK